MIIYHNGKPRKIDDYGYIPPVWTYLVWTGVMMAFFVWAIVYGLRMSNG